MDFSTIEIPVWLRTNWTINERRWSFEDDHHSQVFFALLHYLSGEPAIAHMHKTSCRADRQLVESRYIPTAV